MSQTVQSRLKKFQEKLLDLSKRNRLLNYRPLKASTVPIVDELPAEIFRLLVSSSRGFKFLPRPDDGGDERPGRPGEAAEGAVNEAAPGSPPEAPAGGPDPGGATEGAPDGPPLPLEAAAEDLGAEKLAPTRAGAAGPAGPAGSVTSGGSDAGAGPGQLADPDEAARDGEPSFTREFQPYREADLAERHVDRRLQTPLDPQRLDANLLRIYQQASSRLEEQGFNTLFLALGALEWYEPGEPGRPLLAPIILVPVELRRRSPRSPFLLHATDEEPLFNPSLAMKLEREVDVRLSELPDDAEEWDVQRIFEELSDALKEQKSWRVVNDTALGLFSFTKFIMYKDLEASADLFAGHPIICRLCGEPAASEPETSFPAPGEIDALLDPETTYQVLDADSSQQEAILAVKNGASLVLEGPPGTGKSQTITNIVAECLAAGKRVLFVSEKMAALEVVYNRLRHVGLADFCLELHSRHTSKRSVVEELGRTLALGDQRQGTPESDRALTRLQGIRERLNRHVESLAAPLAPLGVTPYEALSRVAALEETPEVALGLEDVASWDRDRFDAALALLEQLANARLDVARDFPDSGNHEHHPWRGSRLPELDYRGSVEIRSALDDEVAALERLRQDAASLAGASASEPPGSTDDVGRLLNLTERLLETPRPSPESLRDPGWAGDAAEALRVVETCRRFAELRGELGSWSPALLDADPERLSRELRGRRGFLRFFQPGWWRVRGELKELRSRPASLPTREAILDDLERGSEARRLREELRAARERGPRLFGALWQGEESDPAALERFGEWIVAFRPHVDRAGDRTRELCELAARGFEATSVPREALARLEESLQRHEATWTRLSGAARLDDEAAFGRRLDLVGFDALATRFAAMAASVEALHAWGRLVTAREACDAAGVGRFIETADEGPVAPDHLARAFERLFLRTWLDHAFRERPELRQFNRRAHEQAIREFQELDLHQLLLARQRLRQRLVEGLPDARWEASARSELGILKREIRRKRGHKPLRKLFRTIPHALAQLKPCFLMSPLSVAQFLDPRLTRFDVVIFDEASQIAPEDAIGAIARGEQLVVVGDSRQLPPTTFFQAQEFLAAGDEGDEETPDLESILDECVVAALPRRMLRWHYRSRHESLIAFSNQHFYDGRLQTFPGCSVAGEDLGVEFVSVDGVFDRSRSRSNPVESEVVAEAVFDHYRRRPELSLGVGTFSQAQQMAILDRLEELRRRDESLEEHFDPDRPEHFFVKNLENIQGDERDVIFISVGYGPDSSGKIRLNFGPLNRAGGERRLNVLVTRARRRLVVFSSMHGADIPESRVSSSGALLLKRYLDYAEHGARTLAPASQEDDAPQETAMERAIARRLEAAGLDVERGVGLSRHRVGLAVRDAGGAARFVLGVDWDGASYQGYHTARDRERLRQQVLEGLGWQLHRVWSAEWLRNPEAEVEQILEAVDAARRGEAAPAVLPLLATLTRPAAGLRGGRQTKSGGGSHSRDDAGPGPLVRYVLAELDPAGEPDDFDSAPRSILSRLVKVVEAESPVHRDEAARRVASCWGITRLSRSVEEKIAAAVETAAERGRLRLGADDFLWSPGEERATPRVRDGDDVPREPELIAREEIAELADLVLEREYRLARDDLIPQVARLFGFGHTGSKLRERIADSVDLLIAEGRALEDEGGVRRSNRPEPTDKLGSVAETEKIETESETEAEDG